MAKGKPKTALDLANRLALSLDELAQTLGVSIGSVRKVVPEIPHTHIGTRVLFPTDEVRKWLAAKTITEGNSADAIATEILGELQRG